MSLLFGVILILLSIVVKVVVIGVGAALNFGPQEMTTLNNITNYSLIAGIILVVLGFLRRNK
jgi:hypothetical protein